MKVDQEQLPQIHFDRKRSHLHLEAPYHLNEGIAIEKLEASLPFMNAFKAQNPKLLRAQLDQLSCQFDQDYLMNLVSRTLSGSGLSELKISLDGVRLEIYGLLSREGRKTPFWTRGFLFEKAGPYGGAVFYEIRFFGRPGLPAPALIPLLAARTGRYGPVRVRGGITLQFDPLSLLLRWGMAAAGWKIPNYQKLRLHRLEIDEKNIRILYNHPQNIKDFVPLSKQDPLYGQWMALRQAEQLFFKAETLIGRGDYESAIVAYEEELWRHPGHTFVQERLIQLYISSSHQELWNKAYRLAEEMLRRNPYDLTALNCLAQYAEGNQDYKMAANFYHKMGQYASSQGEHIEASLAFGKAAELMEGVNSQQAYHFWQKTRQENANYRPAITALAKHALLRGENEKAEILFKELIKRTPLGLEKGRSHLSLANLYRQRLKKLDLAYEQLQEAKRFLSEDPAYLRELADYQVDIGDPLEALEILQKLTERVHVTAHATLHSEILFRMGQILEDNLSLSGAALSYYQQAAQLNPENAFAVARAHDLEQRGIQPEPFSLESVDVISLNIERKERLLQRMTEAPASEQANLHLDLGRLYWQQGNIDKAIEHGHEAIKLQVSLSQAWQLLEEVCVRSQRHQELADIHKEMAQKTIFDQDGIRHLEEALRLIPHDQETFRQLSQKYRQLQQWQKLEILYNRWIEIAKPSEIADLWQEKAVILEQHLQKIPEAELSYIRAYQTAINPIPYVDGLVQFYIRHNEWAKLDRQIDRLAQSLEPAEKAALFAEKGRLLVDHPRKLKEAFEAYQKAIEFDPENPDYLRPAIEIAKTLDDLDTDTLTSLLAALAEHSQDDEEIIDVRLELAQLYENNDAREQAKEQYIKILALDEGRIDTLLALASIYDEQNAFEEALQTYLSLQTHLPTEKREEQLRVNKKIILLSEKVGQLDVQETAIDALLGLEEHYGMDAIGHIPRLAQPESLYTHARVLFALGQEEKEPLLMLRAALLIEEEDPATANLSLNFALELAPFEPHIWLHKFSHASSENRANIWKELEEQILQNSPETTILAQLDTLFEELRHEPLTLEELSSFYDKLQQEGWIIPQLSHLYIELLENEDALDKALEVRQTLLNHLPKGEARTALQFEIAIHQIQIFGDKESGRQNLWSVVEEEPTNMDAFYELQQLYEEEDALADFVSQLEAVAQEAPFGPARSDLYVRSFELYKNLLEDESAAKELLDRAKENAKEDSYTLQAVAAAYEELGAFEEAAQLYEEVALILDEESALTALERAGELFQHELEQPDKAIEIYQQILEKSPGHPAAIDQLKGIYESLWMWQELAELIEHEVNHLDDKKKSAELLLDLAELYLGRLEDYEKALSTYRWALRVNPRETRTLQALHALYEDLEDWPAVVGALKAMTRTEVDPDTLCEQYMQIAQISLDRLYKIEDTEKYYKLAHTQKPDLPDPLEGLINLYSATENWEELSRVYAQFAILSQKQKNLSDAKEALQGLIDTLALVEKKQTPQDLLRELIQEQHESAELAQELFDLLAELTLTISEEEQTISLVPMRLYKKQLKELALLTRAWTDIEANGEIPLVPKETQERLTQLALADEWTQLITELDRLVDEDDPTDETPSYLLVIAEIALFQLEDIDKAISTAQLALEFGAFPERGLEIIEKAQEKQQQFDLEALIKTIDKSIHPDEQIRALYHLGKFLLLDKENWNDGLRCFIESMARDPEANSGQLLVSLYTINQTLLKQNPPSPTELFASIDEQLPETQKLLLKAWLFFIEQETHQAIETLENIINIEEDTVPALRILGAHFFQSEAPEQAAFYLYRYLELEWDRLPYDEVLELCLQLGYIAELEEDWENVLFYMDQASQFIPEDPRIFNMQIHAMTQAALWDDLKKLYETRVAHPEITDDYAELWFQFGRLYINHFDNPEEAHRCYQKALAINPLHKGALEAVQQLLANLQ